MRKILLTFILFSTLSATPQCKPLLCEKINPCSPGPTGPRGSRGERGHTGRQGEKGDPGKPFSSVVLYAFNNELPNDNTEEYPSKFYNAGESLIFDNVSIAQGSIEAISNTGGTTFVFGEKGTYEVTVFVYLPSLYSPGSPSLPAAPHNPNNGSIQALINGQTVSSLPPTPGNPQYFITPQFNGYPLVYHFVYSLKKGQTLAISPVSYLAVNNKINSCSIKIVKLY